MGEVRPCPGLPWAENCRPKVGVSHSHGGEEGEGGQQHGGAHSEGEGGVGGRGPVLKPQVERQEGAGPAAAGEQDPGLHSQDVQVSQGLG